jgi:sugar phosphate permease
VAGLLGQHYGWRSSFWLFGGLGALLGLALLILLREPSRSRSPEGSEIVEKQRGHSTVGVAGVVGELFRNPMVRILTAAFIGANFVAMIFLTWMPSFLYRKFNLSLAMAGVSATVYLQIASVLGVLTGGLMADRLARRRKSGRILTQAVGLALGVPFVFLAGWTISVPLVILALTGFGYFKGLYDANIWASLHDVVRPERRASAVGFMNSLGWVGGGAAPVLIAKASDRFGMSACISANSIVYLLVALLLVYGISRHLGFARTKVVSSDRLQARATG